MPGVLKFTPTWLSRPSPGYNFFAPSHDSRPILESKNPASLPRTVAHRGTEVFVAIGKELRWSDLVLLKETWENNNGGEGAAEEQEQAVQPHRVSTVSL